MIKIKIDEIGSIKTVENEIKEVRNADVVVWGQAVEAEIAFVGNVIFDEIIVNGKKIVSNKTYKVAAIDENIIRCGLRCSSNENPREWFEFRVKVLLDGEWVMDEYLGGARGGYGISSGFYITLPRSYSGRLIQIAVTCKSTGRAGNGDADS